MDERETTMSITRIADDRASRLASYDPDTHRLLLAGDDEDGPRGWQDIGSPTSPHAGVRYAYEAGGAEYRAACEALARHLGGWEAVDAARTRAHGVG